MDSASQTPAYDAFGDPAASKPRVTSSRRARNAVVAVFWSVAVLLIAGRVYQSDTGAFSQVRVMEIASR